MLTGRSAGLPRVIWTLLLAGSLLLASLAPAASADGSAAPTRVMLVGDSVTQGSAGDYTWRYRLWQHFQRHGVGVDLVGPRQDLFDLDTWQSSYDYVDPAFDRDHAAKWGVWARELDPGIGTLVRDHHPDVVVEMLGVNDLHSDTPEQVAATIRAFVEEARAADPTIDLVLCEAIQRWRAKVPPLNGYLASLATELDTDTSRVVLARTSAGFDEIADTWDTAHPNARGELKIAAAVEDALSTIGVGPPATRPLPSVKLGPRVAPVLAATRGDRQVTLSWTGPPGATGQYVWQRDRTAGESWHRLLWKWEKSPWTGLGLVNGHRYEFKLQPVKGDEEAAADIRSNVVSVVPQPAPPGAVPAPRLTARDHALSVRWSTAARAATYLVRWWPTNKPGTVTSRSVTGTSTTIKRLRAGRAYAVTVQPRNGGGSAPASPTASATPLGPRPAAPRNLTLARADGHRVRLTWRSGPVPTRFQVQQRRRSESAWKAVGWTSRRTYRTTSLAPARYVFRVRAWHQDLAGGTSASREIKVR